MTGGWGDNHSPSNPPDASPRARIRSLTAEQGAAGTEGPPKDSEPAQTRTAAPEVSR